LAAGLTARLAAVTQPSSFAAQLYDTNVPTLLL
jgi:hypothetical protein